MAEQTIHLKRAINVQTTGQVERVSNLCGDTHMTEAGTTLVRATEDGPIVAARTTWDVHRTARTELFELTAKTVTVPWHNNHKG